MQIRAIVPAGGGTRDKMAADSWPQHKGISVTIAALFFFSGMCGLVYAVVWTRMLGLAIGNTAYAVATMLIAFMGGLALGSGLAGTWAGRVRRPVRVYAVLETLVGLYCMALPFLIQAAEPLFGAFYRHCFSSFYVFSLLRFAVCAALVLLPSTLMGATLPILVKHFARSRDSIGLTVGGLYALNMAGAVAGALGAGFVFIPAMGLHLTTWLAGAANVVIGLTAAALDARLPGREPAQPRLRPEREAGWRLYVTALAVSGFVGMALQIAWTRALALVIGSSTYAFSLIAAGFILGLAAGSAAFGRWADRWHNRVRALGLTQVGIALAALLTALAVGKLPVLMVSVVQRCGDSFGAMQAAGFAMVVAVLLVPTFLMGGMLPLVCKLCIRDPSRAGEAVGRIYAWNILGAIVGSFCGGFILMKLLGAQHAIYAAAAADALMGALILSRDSKCTRGMRVLAPVAALGLVAMLCVRLPSWSRLVMASGAYLYSDSYRDVARAMGLNTEKAMQSGVELLFYKDGPSATVSVIQTVHGHRLLRVNGKTDACTGTDLLTQRLLGHLPVLVHGRPKRALVVGMGAGITSGSVLRHAVGKVDSIELRERVVEAARRFFDEPNYGCCDDPRRRIVVADGRTHVALSRERYDVIAAEPPNPWVAGVGSLFTKEFFEQCAHRLAPGGVMASWLHSYHMSLADFRMVVNTFRSAFPESSLWYASAGDYIMIGAKDKLRFDYTQAERLWQRQDVRADLATVGLHEVSDLLPHLLFGPSEMEAFGRGAGINTDDSAQLEFSAPKSVGRDHVDMPYDIALEAGAARWPLRVEFSSDAAAASRQRESCAKALAVRNLLLEGKRLADASRQAEAERAFRQVLKLAPRNAAARLALVTCRVAEGEDLLAKGQVELAAARFEDAVEIKPDSVLALKGLALACFQADEPHKAIASYRKVLALAPDEGVARLELAKVLMRQDRPDEAIVELEQLVETYPSYVDGYVVLASALAQANRVEQSICVRKRAAELGAYRKEHRQNMAMPQ